MEAWWAHNPQVRGSKPRSDTNCSFVALAGILGCAWCCRDTFEWTPPGVLRRVLGVWISSEGVGEVRLHQLQDILIPVFKRWSKFGLSESGRVHVVNSEGVSKLWHRLMFMTVSDGTMQGLWKLIGNYVRHAAWARQANPVWEVRRNVYCLPRRLGGMGLLHLQHHLTALRASVVARWVGSSVPPVWGVYADYWIARVRVVGGRHAFIREDALDFQPHLLPPQPPLALFGGGLEWLFLQVHWGGAQRHRWACCSASPQAGVRVG